MGRLHERSLAPQQTQADLLSVQIPAQAVNLFKCLLELAQRPSEPALRLSIYGSLLSYLRMCQGPRAASAQPGRRHCSDCSDEPLQASRWRPPCVCQLPTHSWLRLKQLLVNAPRAMHASICTIKEAY